MNFAKRYSIMQQQKNNTKNKCFNFFGNIFEKIERNAVDLPERMGYTQTAQFCVHEFHDCLRSASHPPFDHFQAVMKTQI